MPVSYRKRLSASPIFLLQHAITMGFDSMQFIQALVVAAALLPSLHAQPRVERDFSTNCMETEATARAYLHTRGFTEPECANCPNSLRSPNTLLDAGGKSVGTQRIRRDLVSIKAPLWVWSSPLHARVFIWRKPLESGCRLALWMDFYSVHTMVLVIIPVGEPLGLPSNGRLERDYLDAIQAQLPLDQW